MKIISEKINIVELKRKKKFLIFFNQIQSWNLCFVYFNKYKLNK